MFKSLTFSFLFIASLAGALASPYSPSPDIKSVLSGSTQGLRWDDLLMHLNNEGKGKVMGFTAASGAVAGALAGMKNDTVSGVMAKVPEPGLDLNLPGGMDPVYGAAAGAALGSLLGASHIAFVDSAVSDQLREDPKNPMHFRMHLFQLVGRMNTKGATLALNASF